MKIIINYAENMVPLDISGDSFIWTIKEKLRYVLNIEPQNQFYFFKGGILMDNKYLSSYNIQEGNIITLYTYLPESKKMEITIKTLTGKEYTLNVEPSNRVVDVKFMIEKKESLIIDKQRLIYEGFQLDDNRTLADYKIGSNAVLHLVLRLRGGNIEYTI